jgi:hypothetical protein
MTYLKYYALFLVAIAISTPLLAHSETEIDGVRVIFSEAAKASLLQPADEKTDAVTTNDPFLFLEYYGALLKTHTQPITRNGIKTMGVDYVAWRNDPNHARAMAALKHSRTEELNTRERGLSFWINTFNLLVIDLIVVNNEAQTIQNLGGIVGDPWSDFSWNIGKSNYTLKYISQQVIAEFMEPRAYFALSRASIGTPSLLNKPYSINGIYTLLNKQAKGFINNKNHAFRIDKIERTRIQRKDYLYLSKVFKWHEGAMKRDDPMRYINKHYTLPENLDFKGYIHFDWTLNSVATPTDSNDIFHAGE